MARSLAPLCTLVLALALCVISSRAALRTGVQISGADTNWARIGGTDVVTVRGVGFRTYSVVTCEWDGRFKSSSARIIDDNTISCVTPKISKTEVQTVPFVAPFIVYFDGNPTTGSVISTTFTFGMFSLSLSLSLSLSPTVLYKEQDIKSW
jgi:hypothetical protein